MSFLTDQTHTITYGQIIMSSTPFKTIFIHRNNAKAFRLIHSITSIILKKNNAQDKLHQNKNNSERLVCQIITMQLYCYEHYKAMEKSSVIATYYTTQL